MRGGLEGWGEVLVEEAEGFFAFLGEGLVDGVPGDGGGEDLVELAGVEGVYEAVFELKGFQDGGEAGHAAARVSDCEEGFVEEDGEEGAVKGVGDDELGVDESL